MARKDIFPSTLTMTTKKYYPLLVRQSPVPPHPETPSYLSSLSCTESESSGDDQTESDSLEAPADGSEEERSEISLVGESDDMTGKHRGGEQIPLEQHGFQKERAVWCLSVHFRR